MERIRKYFDLQKEITGQRIDDNTCADLNIDELFHTIDYTDSSIGQQYLYSLLRIIPQNCLIKEYEEWIGTYAKDPLTEKVISLLFKKMDNPDAYFIYPLINREYIPYTPMRAALLRVFQLLPTLSLVLFLALSKTWLLVALLLAFIANMFIHIHSKTISFRHSGSIPQLFNLLVCAGKLNKLSINKNVSLSITENIKDTLKLRRKTALFRFDVKLESDIAALVWTIHEIIKVFFLIEPVNLNIIFTQIKEKRQALKDIFNYVGLIDTLQSVARFRREVDYYCLPQFTTENVLEADALYHPLIPNCVPNSFLLRDESFVVMGSNMSGKTTFIRTVGVNILLGQTINTCLAQRMKFPKQSIFTAIHIQDSLMEGHSYYLSEVIRIKNILDNSGSGTNLILLDELFKGTNTIERIASAKAVLSYLAKNPRNRVFAATHDMELIHLLGERYTPVYFIENISGNELSFDYKIVYGQSTQKNAIRILGIYDYPPPLIEDALQTAAELAKEPPAQR